MKTFIFYESKIGANNNHKSIFFMYANHVSRLFSLLQRGGQLCDTELFLHPKGRCRRQATPQKEYYEDVAFLCWFMEVNITPAYIAELCSLAGDGAYSMKSVWHRPLVVAHIHTKLSQRVGTLKMKCRLFFCAWLMTERWPISIDLLRMDKGSKRGLF